MNAETFSISSLVSDHETHLRERCVPGAPQHMTSALTPKDRPVAQGDLYFKVVSAVPKGYTRLDKPPLQLVPESGAGSHHRLDSLDGVEFWVPKGWNVSDGSWESLEGPCLVLTEQRTVVHDPGTAHPHGPVTIDAGLIVECRYQRNWSQEQRREARARD